MIDDPRCSDCAYCRYDSFYDESECEKHIGPYAEGVCEEFITWEDWDKQRIKQRFLFDKYK